MAVTSGGDRCLRRWALLTFIHVGATAKTHGIPEIIGSYFFGLAPLVVLMWFNWEFVGVLVPLFILYIRSKRYFEKWIDGYTGDCLGAVEQLAECICLLSYIGLWKFM
ncbi:MAG: adenosylcobinamide-GDP ribazoletransferase [Saprospiraceae bacterium]|nr:adenosylcobinamide-GDP ribazoletransferase [Saprospiraceae bacterium]